MGDADCSRYSTDTIEWTNEDVKDMDQEIRKIITIYGGLYPRSNVEPLYQERKEVVGL